MNYPTLTIQGIISEVHPERSGTSKAGNKWSKQTAVIQSLDPNTYWSVHFSMWGVMISQANLYPNEHVELTLRVESRPYDGKWYTELQLERITKLQSYLDQTRPQAPSAEAKASEVVPAPQAGSVDDLPF